MANEFFRSITGDNPVDQMGLTYSHEHIVIDHSYPTSSHPEFLLNDIDKIAQELTDFYKAGGRTMVDTMPSNAGRNAEKMAQVSTLSKVKIIVPTGIHLEVYYPNTHWRYGYTEEQLTSLFIADIEEGIDRYDYSGPFVDRTTYKAGVIKLATGDEPISDHQKKIFSAVVNTQLATGAPILTHTNFGRNALEQVRLFKELGANMEHIVISHVDRYKDVDYHKELLDYGVFVEYDSTFRWKENDKNWTLFLLEKLMPAYSNQITMGMDMAKNAYWKSYGGSPGLNYLIDKMPEFFESKGFSDGFQKVFFDNPMKLYAFFKV